MALTVQSFMRNSRSLRRVMEHIGTHLDDELRIADLADIAELSRAHFLRLYADKIRETPIGTVRRLRLQRAWSQIAAGRGGLAHIGADAGYGSNAAFAHAFVRQFGIAPSRLPSLAAPGPAVAGRAPLRLAWLPQTQLVAMPYRGDAAQFWAAGHELNARVAVAGARHWRFWHWLDVEHPFAERGRCIDSVGLVHVGCGHLVDGCFRVPGLDHLCMPAGPHAVFSVQGRQAWPDLAEIDARIPAETGRRREDERRILYRELKVTGYRAPQDREVELWVPLRGA